MYTYTTIDGRVLDLTSLSDEERGYLEDCYAAYQNAMAWADFDNTFVTGSANPLLRETKGWITQKVWDHPLFQAVYDLSDRLGIRQGEMDPDPGDDPERDPFADEWVPATEAARRKGVTLSGLHQAIQRGDVIARPAKPGGSWLVVSVNSLNRWRPNRARQAAGRKARSVAAAS